MKAENAGAPQNPRWDRVAEAQSERAKNENPGKLRQKDGEADRRSERGG